MLHVKGLLFDDWNKSILLNIKSNLKKWKKFAWDVPLFPRLVKASSE